LFVSRFPLLKSSQKEAPDRMHGDVLCMLDTLAFGKRIIPAMTKVKHRIFAVIPFLNEAVIVPRYPIYGRQTSLGTMQASVVRSRSLCEVTLLFSAHGE